MKKTRKNSPLMFLLIALMALMIAACGGDDDEDSDNNDDNNDTPAAVSLDSSTSQEYEGLNWTISHPDSWIVDTNDFGTINIASSQAFADAVNEVEILDPVSETGQTIRLSVFAADGSPFTPDEAGYTTLLAGLTEGRPEESTPINVGSSEDYTAGDFSGRRGEIDNENGGGAVYLLGNDNFILLILGASTDFNADEATLDAIVQSITAEAVATDDTTDNGDATDGDTTDTTDNGDATDGDTTDTTDNGDATDGENTDATE